MKVRIPNRYLIESLVVRNNSMLLKVQERVDAVLKIDKKVGTTTDDGMQVVSEGVAPAPIEEGKEEQGKNPSHCKLRVRVGLIKGGGSAKRRMECWSDNLTSVLIRCSCILSVDQVQLHHRGAGAVAS